MTDTFAVIVLMPLKTEHQLSSSERTYYCYSNGDPDCLNFNSTGYEWYSWNKAIPQDWILEQFASNKRRPYRQLQHSYSYFERFQ